MAVERSGPVRTAMVESDSIMNLLPVVHQFVDRKSYLMTDQLKAYKQIGLKYASHQSVNHSIREYARGEVHNNTAESFSALIERAIHYWSKKHMQRYLHEIGFRWNHRIPKLKKARKGKIKIVMV